MHEPATSARADGDASQLPDVRATVLALGVVFGDIGTSPLYALKECVQPAHGVAATPDNVLGILSLVFWALILVVTVKYLTFILRADNGGEGGILALLALVPERLRAVGSPRLGWAAALGLFGAALLYGDGVITPAISVLSAVEGLAVATEALAHAVLPVTCVVLLALFAVQRGGTAGVGRVFGPIMVTWFVAIGGLGTYHLARNPVVLGAVSPAHAIRFFHDHGLHGLVILGSVVLAITGAEALYADMGHFGRRPIRLGWYCLALPGLVLNYFGQGANLLLHPDAAANPFFALVPRGPATYALVALATTATVIASQALISGAFSLTRQAVQLGYLPRMQILHTSRETAGQIYVPAVNWALAVGCIALVLLFRESSGLAAAYGVAVTGSMTITSVLFYVVARHTLGWPRSLALPLLVLFLGVDLLFLGANLFKLLEGGYIPLLIAAALFTAMAVWKRGRALMAAAFRDLMIPLPQFERRLHRASDRLPRVPGTAVFLTSNSEDTPPMLAHHVRHNKALQRHVVLLTVITERVPRVPPAQRVHVTELGPRFYRILVHSGFMQGTSLPTLLRRAVGSGLLAVDPDDLTYYLGRENILATEAGRMGRWTEGLFAFMMRNARSAAAYFDLPADQVVELGLQIDL
ncbi:potassium transporter Kup [Nannocystis sp. SCPEA4]|uniref:potassium transporter Kup n=1 Tax=Nannocystis sp. SCPEA4 TaxID=2996787 RepID=UPI002270BBC5|nr:potassium transporter Kup [Nannocystis sp. SCPEA4]MCY1056359.1 potassium transporter Kup [Nannocystis sp. SCPEA4]